MVKYRMESPSAKASVRRFYDAAPMKKPTQKPIDRPFASEILRRAKEIATAYQVVMWEEDGEFYGRGVELPGTFDDGKTPGECMRKTRDAFVATVATMLEDGETPPSPVRDSTARTEQINVRLTAAEKAELEAKAQRSGFKGLSDFVRSAALAAESN
jgi:predicted RNase H-like HicB family nuclease